MKLKPDAATGLFGFCLSVAHILTFFFWVKAEAVLFFSDGIRVCWPFLTGCYAWPRPDFQIVYGLLGIYFFLSLFCAASFLTLSARISFWALLAASAFKLGLYLQDFRLMGNYHYMHFWLLFAYLFLPQKLTTARLLIIGFYLAAGFLKLNFEWLSGAALLRESFLTGKWLEWALVYVVILELALVLGLLSSRPRIFWLTMIQLGVFHAFSYFIVGWFYPAMMCCFLSVFVLGRFAGVDLSLSSLRGLNKYSALAMAAFAVMQFSALAFGHSRLALNMLDQYPTCEFFAFARFKNDVRHLPSPYVWLEPRLRCETPVYKAAIHHLCQDLRSREDFTGLDVALISRRRTQSKYSRRFERWDVCAKESP
jgi:hypothetical protein